MDERQKILVIDDDRDMCEFLSDVLEAEGLSVLTSADSSEAAKILKREEFDCIISDLKMKGLKGLDLLEEAKKVESSTPVIIITAFGTIESAIKAMKMGAYDYVTKPFRTDEIVVTVKKALENRMLRKEVVRLKKEMESRYHFHRLIGRSPSMQKIYDLIERIGSSSNSVLITGASGTGKELVAKAVHYSGSRNDGPFIAVNCAAIPEALLESEMFGYKRGAFTDAKTDKKGLLFEAKAGTVFLDEVTEMAPVLQAKLLRVIEERSVRPLGDTNSYPVDVRFIASSNRDIREMIRQGRFREDLYYRLKVIDIALPPLQERKEDIPLLVHHFIQAAAADATKHVSGLSEEAMKALMNYGWPGNVRELENVIQRAVTLCRHEVILPEDLPAQILEETEENFIDKALREKRTVVEMEKEYVRKVLLEVGGNKSKAAQILGLDRKTLYRKLEES